MDIEHDKALGALGGPRKAQEVKPISPQGKTNRKRAAANVEVMRVAARRARITKFLLAGVTYRDIAVREGVSLGTVANDRKAIIQEWRSGCLDALHEHITLDLVRLERLIERLTVQMAAKEFDGDPRVFAVYVQVLKRKAALLGLDARDRAKSPIPFPSLSRPEVEQRVPDSGSERGSIATAAAARLYAAFNIPTTCNSEN